MATLSVRGTVQCQPGRYGKESRLLLVAFPSALPIGGERSDVSTLYSYVVWRHAGTAAGHTPYTQTRTGPAGRSSVLPSWDWELRSVYTIQPNRVLAVLIETKWRISVVSECCWEAVLASPRPWQSPDCIPIVGSVKPLVPSDKRFNHTKVWCTFIFSDLQAR